MRYALLSCVGTENIGDDIQNLAAAAFLPRIDCRIPREALDAPVDTGPVRMILNGWFMHQPRRWPPARGLQALPISMHIAHDDPIRGVSRPEIARSMLRWRGRRWLRRNGPVGARDRWTLGLLQARGIESYLSGCLTLTLLPRPQVWRHGEVIACDLTPDVLAALCKRAGTTPKVVTHAIPADLADDARTVLAESLLDLYAGARLVVTSRLHCALPCLALGTPVLFVAPEREPERFAPAIELAHHCTAADFVDGRTAFDCAAPPPNPDRHQALAVASVARCRRFISDGPGTC